MSPDNMLNHTTDDSSSLLVKRNVRAILDNGRFQYRWIDHQPVFTMEEAEKVVGHKSEQGVKVLMVSGTRENQKQDILIVWSGDERVNFKTIEAQTNLRKLKLSTENTVKKMLGIEVGSLSPFGYELQLPVCFQTKLLDQQLVYINPGVHNASVELNPKDLLKAITDWNPKGVNLIYSFKRI